MSTRLFVAIELPEHVKDEVFGVMFGVPGARWSNEDQLHLTVRFLGEVDGALQRDVLTALSRVKVPPFTLELSGVGYFPPKGPTRVLWVGVTRSEPLEALRKWVDVQMTRLGVPPDRRRYVPHVTVARLTDTPPSRVGRFMVERGLFKSPPFEVDAIHLYASERRPSGAVYEHLAEIPLPSDAPPAP